MPNDIELDADVQETEETSAEEKAEETQEEAKVDDDKGGDEAGTDLGKTDEDGESESDDRVKFTPEQQEIFEKRLGKEVGKRKAIETELTEVKAKLIELEAKDAESSSAVAQALALDPSYLNKEDRDIVLRANALEQRQQILLNAWDDGIESDDPSAAKTAKQVRAEYAEVTRELNRISGRANMAYEQAKKIMLSDMAEGRKLRLSREALAKNKPSAPTEKKSVLVKPAAKPSAPKRPVAAGPSVERFKKAGATLEAAAAELENL